MTVKINPSPPNISKNDMEKRKNDRSRKLKDDIFKMEFEQVPFFVKKAEYDEYGSVYTFTAEAEPKTEFLRPYLSPDMTIFDIGAGVGAWSLPALANGARVVAFEPDPRACIALADSAELNRFDRLLIIQKAIADQVMYDVSFDELQHISMTTIDNFVETWNIQPTYIALDIEGLEVRAIQGAIQTLGRYKPKVMVENHFRVAPGAEEWIQEQMKNLGYERKDGPRLNNVSYSFFF